MDPGIPLVVKDFWQYTDREEEGGLLREATNKGVINVARYHHHSTVCIHGKVDDTHRGIRRSMDIRTASNYNDRSTTPIGIHAGYGLGKRQNGSKSSEKDAFVPPSKRPRLTPSAQTPPMPNRIHRRVVMRDYGKPIYRASTHMALLSAFRGCIEGHRSLRDAGILHRDIPINNLMINEDEKNPSWPSFLIDLDLAIKLEDQHSSTTNETEKAGTRAFMAVGVLLGEKHTFMYDLESFFWVFIWICIHYEGSGPGRERVVARFDRWHYADTEELANIKKGTVSVERDFLKFVNGNFTSYYQPLIPVINALRNVVFPGGRSWALEDVGLYDQMLGILKCA